MAITIVGDIYTVAERAKAQGYIASVWAVSAVVGPDARRGVRRVRPAGAGSSSSTSRCAWWRRGCWSATSTRPSSARGTASTSRGAVLLTVVADPADPRRCSRAGTRGRGLRCRASARSASARLLLVAFVARRARAAEPVLPLWVFSPPAAARPTLVGARRRRHAHRPDVLRADLPRGAARRRRRSSPGSRWRALTIGWPIAASLSGRLYLRFGFRTTATHRRHRSWCVGAVGAGARSARRRRCCAVAARRASSSVLGFGFVGRPEPRSPRSPASAGTSAAWSRAPTCSPGRSAGARRRRARRDRERGDPRAGGDETVPGDHASAAGAVFIGGGRRRRPAADRGYRDAARPHRSRPRAGIFPGGLQSWRGRTT